MSRDPYDALIDQLLREILGGDRPRDITARVMAQAKIHDRFRRRWWITAGSSLAACIAIAAGLMYTWPREYPNTQVDGTILSASGGSPQRGTTLMTSADEGGSVNIGGYVELAMAPDTSLTLGGKKYEENVVLNNGHVDVQVTKNKGKFDVLVGQAVVHVTGTKFGLDVQEGMDPDESQRVKTLFVNVEEGSVDVQDSHQTFKTLKAGSREAFVISTEPVPVIKAGAVTPPNPTTGPTVYAAPARVRQGIGAGMQEGARIGARGNPNRPLQESNASRNGLLAGQNQVQAGATAALVRSMLIIVAPGKLEQTGSLRLAGGWFYLETERGNYLLFPQSAPTIQNFKPTTSHPVHVTWENGKVMTIDTETSTNKPI